MATEHVTDPLVREIVEALHRVADLEDEGDLGRHRILAAKVEVWLNFVSFDQYQEQAKRTALWGEDFPIPPIAYCAGKLGGETGEVMEKIFKAYRDDDGAFLPDRVAALKLELGDVL